MPWNFYVANDGEVYGWALSEKPWREETAETYAATGRRYRLLQKCPVPPALDAKLNDAYQRAQGEDQALVTLELSMLKTLILGGFSEGWKAGRAFSAGST